MKTFDGYKKRNLTDKDYALLAGGGHKALDTLFSALSSDTTNAIKITVGGTEKSITTDTLKTSLGLGSNAYTSTAYLPLAGGTMTGVLTTTSGSSYRGIKVGNTYINAINGDLIFQNNSAIRFGGDSWDWNVWAGLKYVHSSKTIYLGLADGSAFTANSAQSGGKLYLPGIVNIYTGNGSNLVWHAGNDGSGSGLDADLLDGIHANGLFTNLSNSGNNISITIGGTNKTLTPAYATKAGDADTIDNYHASSLWRSDGGTWNPSANILLNASANGQEWSFDIRRNGYTGCYWHVWDSSLNAMLKVNADNGKVYAPYNFVGNLEGNASSATKATQDSDGSQINTTYLKKSGGTMTGAITTGVNRKAICFRDNNTTWDTYCYHASAGNEALVFACQHAKTSFIFYNGDSYDNISSSRWQSLPGVQIVGKGIRIGNVSTDGTNGGYSLYATGTGYFGGNVTSGGSFYANSDIRYKLIQSQLLNKVNSIAELPIFTYYWHDDKHDDKLHIGSSAQAVKEILPELVTYDESKDFYNLDYATLGTIAGITACKELVNQKSEIDLLKEKISILEQKLSKY